MSEARYAIYHTPTDHAGLWQLGSSVIGYDAMTGAFPASPEIAGLTPGQWASLTSEPRRYGLHATLKAPFRLNSQRSEHELRAHFRNTVMAETDIPLAGLEVADLSGFIALTLTGETGPVSRLAMRMVEAFEAFRAPLNEAEKARRLRSPLTGKQQRNLDIYGYPHVGDEFRFHITLTGMIGDEASRAAIRDALATRFAAVLAERPLCLSMISLLKQPAPDQCFRILDQYRLQQHQESLAP